MRTTTVVIGAGHAGLAMSHCLTSRSIDHVVLERGEVANSWKTERWDSLRLLTPNWQSRLPGYGYEGADPDGFRTMPETIAFIERYAERCRGAGRDPHRGHVGLQRRRRLSSLDRSGRMALPDGRRGHGGVQYRERPRGRRGAAARDRDTHADGVSQSGPDPGGRRPDRRGLGHRHAARRGTPARGPARDARRRRARPRASDLPRPGHQVVDGRRRRDGRPL